MANEYTQVLGSTSTNVSVSNTTTLTNLFTQSIPGGTLDVQNRIRWTMQGYISFAGQNENCTLYMYYGGATVSSCIAKNIASSARENKAILIDAELSGDGSPNSQFGTIRSILGLPKSEDGSTPIGFGSVGIGSGGDNDFEIKAKWGSAGASNSIIHSHSSLELLSYIEDVPLDDLDNPTAYIFLNSKLNNLRYDLRKYVYVYLPFKYELDGLCYGEVTFARASTSTATYLDGASHTVAVNEPRFQYTGSTVSGLAINTATETLTVPTSNSIHDSNSLCWRENGVYKSTVRGNTNPFNSSGVWVGNSGIHITEVVKYNKVITSAEDQETENATT